MCYNLLSFGLKCHFNAQFMRYLLKRIKGGVSLARKGAIQAFTRQTGTAGKLSHASASFRHIPESLKQNPVIPVLNRRAQVCRTFFGVLEGLNQIFMEGW
jgi:hypothetical protein